MRPQATVQEILDAYRKGEISQEEAARGIEGLRIGMVEAMARLDLGRTARCGIPEVVLAEGKDPGVLAEIVVRHVQATGRCLVTRIGEAQVPTVEERCRDEQIQVVRHPLARALVAFRGSEPARHGGVVAILTAGTADIPVAEEARVTAEEMGCTVRTAYDVGAAGIHRLFPALREVLDAHVLIVAAGREGTLPAVVAGLVDRPVIGLPVSTGYGYMGRGRAALASMLQSCAVVAVVNIDAGFTAGAFAARIAAMVASR
jgi:pyridinium-3,5-biscarboxylic acid mononucleotide synthase